MSDELDILKARVDELEARHSDLGSELGEARELLDKLIKRQIKTGPLASLAQALAYHHRQVQGWVRLVELAQKGETCDELAPALVRMYDVVTHYEYVAQRLLGINPSPFADLEDTEEAGEP